MPMPYGRNLKVISTMKNKLNLSVLSFLALIGLTLAPKESEASFPVEGCAGGSNNVCCVIWECNNCNGQSGYQAGVLCMTGDDLLYNNS